MGSYSKGNALEEIVVRLENRKLEREIALTEAVEERKRAYELAKSREMFYWSAPGGVLTMLASAYSSLHHKNVLHTLPVLPIMTYLCYQAHLCYGNKMQLIRTNAEKLLAERTSPILRPITLEEVRRRREELTKSRDLDCLGIMCGVFGVMLLLCMDRVVHLMGAVWSTQAVPQREIDRLSEAYDRQISDQIALHNLQFEQKRSFELATNRESIGWEVMAASTVTVALVLTAAFLKNKLMAVPIIALVMGTGYRYDKCYGDHDNEIRECAERSLREDRRRFEMIGGPITLAEIDDRVRSKRERLH